MRPWAVFLSLPWLAGCAAPPAPVPNIQAGAEAVSYPSGADAVRGWVYRPAGKTSAPAVVVIHDDYGPTDWVKEQARHLAGQGYVALAVDLYRGEAVSNLMDAHIMDRGLPEERVLSDLQAAVDYLSGRPDVRGGAVGVIGWGMGGGYALDAARRDPRIRAVVTCYGRLSTDPALLTSLKAPVLGIFGEKDEGITPQTIGQFRTAMERAGRRVAGLHVYPGCGHGFIDPSGPDPHGPAAAEAAADAWGKIEAFFAAELRP